MFGQINISNSPADATERYVAATPNVATNVVDEAKSTAQLEEDIARTRSIIDNIEMTPLRLRTSWALRPPRRSRVRRFRFMRGAFSGGKK